MIGNEKELLSFRYKSDAGPIIVCVDVTDQCNYRCLHCYNNSGKASNDLLSDGEILDVIKQIIEFKPTVICLCGGEPTLRKNYLQLIEECSKNGVTVNMVSNGSLLDRESLYDIKRAGLNTLQISLDGVNNTQHDTFRGYYGAFEKAVNAIQSGIKSGLRVITSFVPNKMNVRTIGKYLEICYELGISEVRIMPLIPMGRGSKIDFLLLTSDEYFVLQQEIMKGKDYYLKKGMYIEWGDPLDHYYRFPYNAKLGIRAPQLEVKSNGNLTISTYIPIVVGNVRKHSIKEYWEKGYKDIWKNKKVVDFVEKIETIYDINNLEPRPYSGEYYNIEII